MGNASSAALQRHVNTILVMIRLMWLVASQLHRMSLGARPLLFAAAATIAASRSASVALLSLDLVYVLLVVGVVLEVGVPVALWPPDEDDEGASIIILPPAFSLLLMLLSLRINLGPSLRNPPPPLLPP